MATDDEIPAVSDVENAKISDGKSPVDEHNGDKVTDTESEEQSTVEENQSEDEVKKESNKRDIDEVEIDEEKTNGFKKGEDEDNETAVSSPNKKIKTTEPSTDETSPTVLSEELTVV